jgi:hypothetical protein
VKFHGGTLPIVTAYGTHRNGCVTEAKSKQDALGLDYVDAYVSGGGYYATIEVIIASQSLQDGGKVLYGSVYVTARNDSELTVVLFDRNFFISDEFSFNKGTPSQIANTTCLKRRISDFRY